MGATNTGGYDQVLSQRLLENNTPSSVLHERIRQLEKQCAVLATEVDRMRPVVEAAVKWNETNYRDTEEIEFALDALGEACDDYQASNPK